MNVSYLIKYPKKSLQGIYGALKKYVHIMLGSIPGSITASTSFLELKGSCEPFNCTNNMVHSKTGKVCPCYHFIICARTFQRESK